MWTRVDRLFVPKADVESLHSMECNSTGHYNNGIPLAITVDGGKLARYYVYLLFRYCISAAENRGIGGRCSGQRQLPLTDIPAGWLQTVAFSSHSSAPSIDFQSVSSGVQRVFAILPNCNHCFCLSCIRMWRRFKRDFPNITLKSCPLCRTVSYYFIPSTCWVEDAEKKRVLRRRYTDMLANTIPCCLYHHTNNSPLSESGMDFGQQWFGNGY
uniref:RING-type domain-containing protein n=1 Tax=Nothobranchius furzeri TaxID=105023 RepID=A0A8C6P4S7_NOTFU